MLSVVFTGIHSKHRAEYTDYNESYTEAYTVISMAYTSIHRYTYASTGIHMAYTGIRRLTQVYTGIYTWRTQVYIWYTEEYTGIYTGIHSNTHSVHRYTMLSVYLHIPCVPACACVCLCMLAYTMCI